MVNSRKDYISISVLFLVNLLNYVDRYTVAGVLTEVQKYYNIDDSMGGLIQTVFLIAFMIFSPVCGYLGDRFNRKLIVFVGVVVWLAAVLASSFVPSNMFWLFLIFRGLVGVGEASYSNVAPSLISDMFSSEIRSRMYMIFYFAIPVGSGLGFIIGSKVASMTGHWQWGVRVSALFGFAVLALIILFVFEPERGAAEKAEGAEEESQRGSYWQDMLALVKIPTFVSCTWGYTALVFVTGTLSWWEPTIIMHSEAWKHNLPDTQLLPTKNKDGISLLFGIITTVAGLVGVILGSLLAQWIRAGTLCFRFIQTERAQPLIAGLGALLSAPLLAVAILFGHDLTYLLWVLLFFCITFLCFNWGLNVDMLTSVIVPSRRSTAFSYFMLISHLFGDASGPYIIGKVSDLLRNGSSSPKDNYQSLVHASWVCVVLLLISAFLYFVSSLTLIRDQRNFRRQLGMDEAKPMKTSTDSIEKIGLEECSRC